MRYSSINSALFTKNRYHFTASMSDKSMAVFCSNDQMPTNADGTPCPSNKTAICFGLAALIKKKAD